MLKTALIGVGGMGRGHLSNLIKLTDQCNSGVNDIIKLVAICDIEPEKLKDEKIDFNLKGVGDDEMDYSRFHAYTDMDELIKNEDIDLAVLALPTYLHCEASVKFLNAGINVFCEKPMALNEEQCRMMIDAADKNGKKLMIGQCLRFWGEYEVLKKYSETKELGDLLSASFFRGGGGIPDWSYKGWLKKRECGGGCLHDQHVHDVDMVQYLFGMPKAVSSMGRVIFEGSGHDCVSTNYIFDSDAVANASDDWWYPGSDFQMTFRATFQNGSIALANGKLTVRDASGNDIDVDYDRRNAYYKELVYFAGVINGEYENTINPPSDSLNTVRIAVAEAKSADNHGKITEV